ncbi:hypothetical protein [Spirosoma sp. 48-14]|uniref:hypothetical protein n=1 Tax=Spirosoma sp. 48-14 TaxID=1895854 RepID=UPI000967A6D8|nr:hypothetical protein [Spirosoma sp. 48-14]OJW75072.1 MAG: hypothetical protein BGO59_19055 [Spirosoma sp. 48-14]
MKLLTYQTFSIYSNGGGSRILRRLFKNHEENTISIALVERKKNIIDNPIKEYQIEQIFPKKRWMKWHIKNIFFYIRNKLKFTTKYILIKQINDIEYDILHIVDHGDFPNLLTQLRINKKIWVSFHDHFLTSGGNFYDSKQLWTLADRRIVISEELGNYYQSIFGILPYEIITDGLNLDEIFTPNTQQINHKIVIYFGGLLHIDYLPLFQSLADALDILSSPQYNFKFKLVLRGTQNIDWLENRCFELEYRSFTINNSDLKKDITEANILYFPIKFNNPYFYLYSMSTKMIGYLGAPGTILYHGPVDSAANKLLTSFQSCVSCTTLDKNDMINCILESIQNGAQFSFNAKKLARQKFNLEAIKRSFWLES